MQEEAGEQEREEEQRATEGIEKELHRELSSTAAPLEAHNVTMSSSK